MIKNFNIKVLIIVFFLISGVSFSLENKIVLKVENNIITTLDIFNEIKDLKFFNKNLSMIDDPNEIYQIALESLLRHEIKKIEVLKNFNNFEIGDKNYLDSLIQNNYKKLGFENLSDFKQNLKLNNIDYSKFKEKIQINLLWNEIIYSKHYDRLVINENKLRQQINDGKKIVKLFNLNEIVYQVQNINEVNEAYNKIKNDIEKLGFKNAAIKHSLSNTANNGGSIGWVDENALNEQIIKELEIIPLKSITQPIRISSGFLILQKFEEKEKVKNLDIDEELKKLMKFEADQQLNNFSNIYFNKVKKDLKINAP